MNKNGIVVLSDIHANLTAFKAVLSDIEQRGYAPDLAVVLGDIVNYGMRPNEVITELANFPYPIAVNLMGNHEKALLDGDLTRFSSERGKAMLEYTSSILTADSLSYIKTNLNPIALQIEEYLGRRLLFLHGNRNDSFWGNLGYDNLHDLYYSDFEYVFSGHTHLPHYISYYYPTDRPDLRNKKKTVFINPGSVGQPRNQNSCAQYAYVELSTCRVHHNTVQYDIEAERCLYSEHLDTFYRDRLILGI